MLKYLMASMLLLQTPAMAQTAAEKLLATVEKTYYKELTLVCAGPGQYPTAIALAESISRIGGAISLMLENKACGQIVHAGPYTELFKDPIDPPEAVLDGSIRPIQGLFVDKEACIEHAKKVMQALMTVPLPDPARVPPGVVLPKLSAMLFCYPTTIRVLNDDSQKIFTKEDRDA